MADSTLPGFFQDGGNTLVRNRIPLDKTIYFFGEVDAGDSSGAVTLDLNQGNKHYIKLVGDVTLTFTDPVGPTNFILRVEQDGTGGHELTLPSGRVLWPDGNEQAISLTAGAICLYGLYFDGTQYYANMSPNYQLP